MDKTLLRPLFQKRFMELHKPQGFVNGGPAMNFQQIAMGNQSKQNDQGIMQVANLMPDASAPVIPIQMKNLSDSDSELNQDAIMNAIEEGRQKAKKFQGAVESVGGINNITQDNVDQVITDNQIKQSELKPEGETQSKEGLFSDSFKRGIFAAKLAQALAQPGATLFSGLATGVGEAAGALGNIRMAELEAEAKAKKDAKLVTMVDLASGSDDPILVPEQEAFQATFIGPNGKPQRRYVKKRTPTEYIEVYDPEYGFDTRIDKKLYNPKIHPMPRGTSKKMVKVINRKTRSSEEIYFDDYMLEKKRGFPNYFPQNVTAESVEVTVNGQPEFVNQDYFDKEMIKLYEDPNYQLPFDPPKGYSAKAAENKELAVAAEKRVKLAEIRKDKSFNALNNTVNLYRLGNKILARKEEAFTGPVGNMVLLIDGGRGFIEQSIELFSNTKRNDRIRAEQAQGGKEMTYEEEIGLTEQYLNDLKSGQLAKTRKAKGQTLSDAEKQFADVLRAQETAGLQSDILKFVYTIAKTNETGGRYSVSDIENAIKQVGVSASRKQLSGGVNSVLNNAIDANVFNFMSNYGYNMTDESRAKRNKEHSQFIEIFNEYDRSLGFAPIGADGDGGFGPDNIKE
tara:strand:+ start:18 stop:1889 length:1872 start_codon:yes stop_codon:yes gene_type:complete